MHVRAGSEAHALCSVFWTSDEHNSLRTCRSASAKQSCRWQELMQCIIKKKHLRTHQVIAVNSAARLNRTTWLHWRPGTPQLCSGNQRTGPPHRAGLHCLPLATFVGTTVLGSPSVEAPLAWTCEGRYAAKTLLSRARVGPASLEPASSRPRPRTIRSHSLGQLLLLIRFASHQTLVKKVFIHSFISFIHFTSFHFIHSFHAFVSFISIHYIHQFLSYFICHFISFHFIHACIQPCREITPRLLQITWELLDGKR